MDAPLSGIRVLVVEDRAPVAMSLCDMLRDHGANVRGPAATLRRAGELADAEDIDVCLLDVDLGGELSFPLARRLGERALPVILMTGFDASVIPDDLRHVPLFDKLGSLRDLVRVIGEAVEPGAGSPVRCGR
jgi:CheY-like chemotaxis protein